MYLCSEIKTERILCECEKFIIVNELTVRHSKLTALLHPPSTCHGCTRSFQFFVFSVLRYDRLEKPLWPANIMYEDCAFFFHFIPNTPLGHTHNKTSVCTRTNTRCRAVQCADHGVPPHTSMCGLRTTLGVVSLISLI